MNFQLGTTAQGAWKFQLQVEAVCVHCLHNIILTAETIKIRKFRTIQLLILDQYVSRWGRLIDMFGD